MIMEFDLNLYPQVPDPSVDSREYLWNRDFKVRVPKTDLIGEAYLKVVGMHVSGDEAFDEIMKDEIITTYMNVDKMVEIFRVGGRLRIAHIESAYKIQRYVDNHLEVWRKHLERSSINGNIPPIDDLILLDEFSELLFGYARWEFANDDALGFLRRQFGKQYKHTVAAIQEAIPTMQSLMNRKYRDTVQQNSGGRLRVADVDEVVTQSSDPLDAWSYKYDLSAATEVEVEKQLPKRESYASFFEQHRQDKSIMKVAPTMDQRFLIPNKASNSLNNRLGKAQD